MAEFWEVALAALFGSGIASTIVSVLLLRRTQRIEQEVQEEFARRASSRAYAQEALYELFGPAKMQFMRTKRAFKRLKTPNKYLEAEVMRTGNIAVRDLLLSKGHLLRPELLDHAVSLIEHYDAWLEEFDRLRGGPMEDLTSFVFAGPKGFPFPPKAENAMTAEADRLQRELFGPGIS